MSIRLVTFDIFGTVLDWRRGLSRLSDREFDRAIDRQGELEAGAYRTYTEILAESLIEVARFDAVTAAREGVEAGFWPLFPDSTEALRKLRTRARCAAITNSDRAHGEDVQAQLGFPLDGWICAEEVRAYKPDERMWQAASKKLSVPFGRDWWHVSAYADYDLVTARKLGLTCVFVERPHSRPGTADFAVRDLTELASLVAAQPST